MSFVVPTLRENIEKAEKAYTALLSNEEMPISEQKVEARILGNAINGLYGYIKYMSLQIIASSSEREFLERHCAKFKIFRKKETYAYGTANIKGVTGASILQGTKATRDRDGLEYEVSESKILSAESDVINLKCLTPGVIGNCSAGDTLTFSIAVAGFESSITAISIGAGADEEKDADLLIRYLDRLQNYPRGGSDQDWITWALNVPGINRAWVYRHEMGVGTVVVRVMTPQGVADETLLQKAYDYIETQKPTSVKRFAVYSLIEKPINFELGVVPNTPEVRNAVTNELADLLYRNAIKGNKKITISQIRGAISLADGEEDYYLINPVTDINCTDGEFMVLGEMLWS